MEALNPYAAMAEVRLIPGNPAPAVYKTTAIEMASALLVERPNGTRIYLRYFPTGEVQQWSEAKANWVTLAICTPQGNSRERTPRCDRPLEFLEE
jgi:hypothetical protein